jgi:hypothetical protein
MAMLWMAKSALTELQEDDNLYQAKENLQNALQAGKFATKLMRTVLNSQKITNIDSHWL